MDIVRINHKKFHSVYDQRKESKGLVIFLLFDISQQTKKEINELCHEIETTLSNFRFVTKFIYQRDISYTKEMYLEEFEEVLLSIESESYSCLLTVLIGDKAIDKYSNDEICFILQGMNNSINLITHEEVTKRIYTRLSQLHSAIPSIVFFNWISQTNQIPPPDHLTCPNAFICFVSNGILNVPN